MRTAQPWRATRARTLRANQTSAERHLWQRLRNRQLCGYKFVRQQPIGPYFADLACREARVIVEIDGGTHGSEAEIAADNERAGELARMGYRILRVTNRDVYDNLDGVLDRLLAFLEGSP